MIDDSAPLEPSELSEAWPLLLEDERVEAFHLLSRPEAEDFFLTLESRDQTELILALPPSERRSWMRLLAPDDAADVIQEAPDEDREPLLGLLDFVTRREVRALLAYEEDEAGGLMNPRYVRLRPDMTVDEAITYFRRQARDRSQDFHYAYVIDAEQHLLGVLSLRALLISPGTRQIDEIMYTDLITVPEDMDQEAVSHIFAEHDLAAIPVVDEEGHIKGVVTVDDIVDVVNEEATEDIQKIGGMEALDEPYLSTSFRTMMRKRAGWLALLLLGETLTILAMASFQDKLARVTWLALFVPLIISSGGNSGSQASTLVVRAMALDEVRLRDWWRILRRELTTGLALGLVLGVIGLIVVLTLMALKAGGTDAAGLFDLLVTIGLTVSCSLVGVVLWGTITGSMLPILLRRLGFDPASASAPLVATMVDVSGLLIYFSVATLVLGNLLR